MTAKVILTDKEKKSSSVKSKAPKIKVGQRKKASDVKKPSKKPAEAPTVGLIESVRLKFKSKFKKPLKLKKIKLKKLTKRQKKQLSQILLGLLASIMMIALVALTVVVVALYRQRTIVSDLQLLDSNMVRISREDCDLDFMIDNLTACSLAVGDGELRRGTAFMISPGFAITNFHVILDVEDPFVNNYDQPYSVQLWAFDSDLDLALLKLPRGVDFPLCALDMYEGELRPLTTLYAVGWPYGATGSPTFTRGELSRYTTFRDMRYLQVDINTSPGNSGGPIATECGVVAINTFRFTIEGHNVLHSGFNMAIPNKIYLQWAEEAIESGYVHELPIRAEDFF
ncbi:MAG: serine protease [Pseudomonadales bacterium]|jgi:hypothetical protein|nr:serine protease [Pseudomonadales bacterium]